MTDKNRHCHWQIQYEHGAVETLGGLDPNDLEQRKFNHKNLDEFLDYLAKKMNSTKGNVDNHCEYVSAESDHFAIFGYIDSHCAT